MKKFSLSSLMLLLFVFNFGNGIAAEDINSSVSADFIEEQAKGINNFEAFCVDYMPGAKLNRFLTSFAKTHDGRIWKATSASELLPIFQTFTTTLRYRYVVVYRVLDPIIAEPAELNIDMLTMVDGSPLSNYLFFETGKSEIPADYVLIKDPVEAVSFDPNSLASALDRYLNILNLVGQNLTRDSTARVKVVGCNSNSGIETANLDLSERRAASVMSYLQEIWGIDASRMDIETRNLPASATAMDLVGARPENQRVEIIYESADLQTAARDDLMVETSGRRQLTVKTNLLAEVGFSDWQLTIFGDDQPLKTLTGQGEIKPVHVLTLEELDMARLTTFSTLGVQAQVTDTRGDVFETEKVILPLTVSSDSPALLDIVKSTYVQEISDAKQFIIQRQIYSGYEIDHWTIKLTGGGNTIESLSGSEDIEPAYHLSLADLGLHKLSTYQTITAGIEVTDRKGQTALATADANVRFIRRKERLAQKEG